MVSFGINARVIELPASTRTAPEAAKAVGCRVEQIAKSLVFRGQTSGRAVLVITGGANRVDEEKLGALVGEPVRPAEPDFVREQTGFSIGGVPPVGHFRSIETFLDEDLFRLEEIWAAAGTPNAVFKIRFADLVAVAGGRVVAIAQRAPG